MTDARHRVSREIIFVEVPSAGPQFERQGRPRPYPVNPRLICTRLTLHVGLDPQDGADADAVNCRELANSDAAFPEIGAEGFCNRPSVRVRFILKLPAAERLPGSFGSTQAGVHPLSDHRPLEFGENAHHLKHGLPRGRGRV